jgi:diacylglycerol kinase family enzyme
VRRAALIVNPRASGVTPERTAAVERELGAAQPVETVLTERPGHAVRLVEDACTSCDRVYVFSGDGGFNEAINGVAPDVPIGFVPGGATSVLPRALGLPRDPVECARVLAGSDRTRTISLGRVNGRRFAFASGLGLDAEVVRAVDARGRERGRRPGDLAFVAALSRAVLRRDGVLSPAMTVVGRSRVAFAIVANCDPYTYAGRVAVHAAPQARFELGLDLVGPRSLARRRIPSLALAVTAGGGGHVEWPEMLYVHDADEVRIECDAPTPLQADGEDLGDVTDAHFRAERGVLSVLVG